MELPQPPTIGVLGVGRMGLPIAARLAAAGHAVTAYDVDVERLAAAVVAGATAAESAEALAAGSGVLITVLPGAQELRHAFCDDGLGAHLGPGSLWLDLTSADPRDVEAAAASLTARGVAVVGAPMRGGPAAAAGGTLGFYVGGAAPARERALALLAPVTDPARVEVAGDGVGDGYTVKLLANTLWFGQVVAAAEVLLLGAARGLEPGALARMLGSSAAGGEFLRSDLPALLVGDYLATFGLARVVEELDVVTLLAADAGLTVGLTQHVAALHREALAEFGEVDGELMAAALLERRAGRLLRAETVRDGGGAVWA